MSVVQNADGRIEMFAVDTANRLWHTWQHEPDISPYANWALLDGARVQPPVSAVRRPDGALEVFARGTDNHLKRIARDEWWNTDWSDWRDLGGEFHSAVAAAVRPDGRIQVFIRGLDNRIWHQTQREPNSPDWQGFAPIPHGLIVSDPVVARSDSRLDVFGRGTDDRLYHAEYARGFTWEPVSGSYDGHPFVGNPAVAVNNAGLPAAYVRTATGSIRYAAPYGTGWYWRDIGGTTDHDPVASSDRHFGHTRVYAQLGGDTTTGRVTDGYNTTDWRFTGTGVDGGLTVFVTETGTQVLFAMIGGRVVTTRHAATRDEFWPSWSHLDMSTL
jgi:hypothetical protein